MTFDKHPLVFRPETAENELFVMFAKLYGEERAHEAVDELMALLPSAGIVARESRPAVRVRAIRIRRKDQCPLRRRLPERKPPVDLD
jgi:hypothetical protein